MANGYATRLNGKRTDWSGWFLYAMLTLLGLFMLLPLVYMVSNAFKPVGELFLFPPRFLVIQPTLKNFYDLLLVTGTSSVPFTRYIFNSGVVSLAVVALGVVISAMAAYPLSKHKDLPFGKGIFKLIILSLMFAPSVMLIPQYLVISKIGLINSYWALIIPGIANTLGLFLMKQFLDQISDALLEAARIDGASEWRVLWQVVFPMLKPAWTTFALVSFIGIWNDGNSAMIYTTSEEMKTLPYALNTINGGAGVVARVGTVGAASLLMTLPPVIVFAVTQRMALETFQHSGIKE